jgi:hypothetical protein
MVGMEAFVTAVNATGFEANVTELNLARMWLTAVNQSNAVLANTLAGGFGNVTDDLVSVVRAPRWFDKQIGMRCPINAGY